MSSAPGARSIFLSHNGPGPWPCYFCHEPVLLDESDRKLKLNVHHEDEDQSNNSPENLFASHQTCHSRKHNIGNQHGLGYSHTQTIRDQISQKLTGIKRSPETVEKIRRARLDYWERVRSGI